MTSNLQSNGLIMISMKDILTEQFTENFSNSSRSSEMVSEIFLRVKNLRKIISKIFFALKIA